MVSSVNIVVGVLEEESASISLTFCGFQGPLATAAGIQWCLLLFLIAWPAEATCDANRSICCLPALPANFPSGWLAVTKQALPDTQCTCWSCVGVVHHGPMANERKLEGVSRWFVAVRCCFTATYRVAAYWVGKTYRSSLAGGHFFHGLRLRLKASRGHHLTWCAMLPEEGSYRG